MKMGMKKLMSVVAAGMVVGSLMVGCGSSSSTTTEASASEETTEVAASSEAEASTEATDSSNAGGTDLLDQVKEKGTLVVGTASGYPPYEFVDVTSADQEVIGIDMALAKAIADDIGVELKIEDMTFSALLSSIPANKIDLAIAGICPTDERKKTVDFSDVYVNAEQKILIRAEDADTLKTLDDFAGKKVGAQKSTTQETLANDEIKDVTVVSLDKVPDLILELLNGKIDGIVVESVVAQQYILANPTLQFSDAEFENKLKPTAVALNKENDAMLEEINKVIKENQDNGNFDKWIEEYSAKANENAQ